MRPRRAIHALLVAASFAAAAGSFPAEGATRERFALRRVDVDLPGAPAAIVPADLDGDGRTDLVVVSVFTEVESIGESRIEDMVQISTVVPALFDRRELRAWLADDDGGYRATPPLPLPTTVHSLEAGPPGWPVVALTDEGVSALRATHSAAGVVLSLDPVIARRTALAGTRGFIASLRLVRDLDGDGDGDLLLPAATGMVAAIDPASGGPTRPLAGLEPESLPDRLMLRYPWPRTARVDGDALPDLVVFDRDDDWKVERVRVLLGTGRGMFRPLRDPAVDCLDRSALRLATVSEDRPPWPSDVYAVRDVDGDGRAELIRRRWIERPGDGLRAGMKEAKRPRQEIAFHRIGERGVVAVEPYASTVIEGHLLDDAGPFAVEPFVDLDGDGREELVVVTLRFSMLQALRVVMTKRISIGVDFHIYRQSDDGALVEVDGLDLSEKLKLDLDDVKLHRFAQFAGDFDGDGLRDFTHFGRGSRVTIHRGVPGCRYPDDPDLEIELDGEPDSLDLIRVKDLDGDGRSDIAVIRPLDGDDPDVTAPTRLELYLSGEGSR